MARYSGGDRTAAGSTTLPLISLYATAAVSPRIREIGAFNTSTVAVEIFLSRLTTTGTVGADLTESKHFPDSTPAATLVGTHTVAPTLGEDLGYRAALGAAIGSGVIWTFGDMGLMISSLVTEGIGIVIENGTGQILQAYIVWDE